MNNFIKKFHQILGIIITFPLILMALTGIILVFFEFQNGWKVNKVLDAEEIIMQFEKAHEGKKVERISLAGKVKIRASQEGKRYNYIFTEGRFAPFQSNLRNFAILIHDARFIPNGRQFVGILGILTLILFLAGFIRYFKQKNLNTKIILKPKNTTNFYRNFHIIIAFRLGIFLAFIIFAGIIIAFPSILTPKKPIVKEIKEISHQNFTLNQEIDFALKYIANSSLYEVNLKPSLTSILVKKEGSILPYIFTITEGKILLESPEEYSLANKITKSLILIHKSKTGFFIALMQVLCGILVIFISISGVVFFIFSLIQKSKLKSNRQFQES